ncbi:hypothetical protein LshimejAT787_0804480 [Lyophyllum shimeji]|uniref:Uncharacterized protein n=1 Tax=Lyophyllum shimeji TaxID=47721 RepID=A0A9P3PSJ8_LYOSH|nr:hypothetical protein LshimejAT787_0804480 [Lyophyllum shimeji]
MIFSRLSLLTLLCATVTIAYAQHNITVNNTSPLIQYEGNAGNATICKTNPDGTLQSGQPGCYNVPSHCTEGATMGQGGSGAASFSFNGTAIYIQSLLDSLSPIYTVTLDGKSTDVDGVRPSLPFVCAPLFSRTGLDPNVEHKVRLSVKGPSPDRNTSIEGSENFFTFSLISFTYTDGGNGTATSANGTASTSSGGSNLTTTKGSNAAAAFPSDIRAPYLAALVAVMTTFASLLH